MTAVEKLAAEVIDIVIDVIEGKVINALSNRDDMVETDGRLTESGALELTNLAKEVYYQAEENVSLAIKAWLSQLLAEVTLHDIDTGGKQDGTEG